MPPLAPHPGDTNAIGRAGFSLRRALFRKNMGPLPNMRIPPD